MIQIGGEDIAVQAAENFRFLRASGLTVRKTTDTLIATRCIQNGLRLLHTDRDFDHFAAHLRLREFGLHGEDKTGRCVDQKPTHELNAQRPIRIGAPTTKLSQREAVDKWTVRAGARSARWPWTTLRVAHRTGLCPQPPTTTLT